MTETTLMITGMTCGGCVRHVTGALRGVPGVTTVEVVLAEGRARVVHDPAAAPVAALVGAVEAAGYAAVAAAPASA